MPEEAPLHDARRLGDVVDRLRRGADGYELTFAVNVLAQYQLLVGVLPALGPGAHVLLLGSGTHYTDRSERLVAHPRWQDPALLARVGDGADDASARAGQRAYATSKLAVNHLAHELDRRLGDRLRVNVYDPGLIAGTGLARDMTRLRRFAWAYVMPYLRLPGSSTAERSGSVLAELALGRLLPELRGAYVDIDRVSRASDESDDPVRERRLWEFCEQVSGAGLPAAG